MRRARVSNSNDGLLTFPQARPARGHAQRFVVVSASAGGVVVPPAGYFEKVQAVLDRYGILMVVDDCTRDCLALSRSREYLADAGSVELTKNPDALISALRKISGHSQIAHAPDEVREMFIDNGPSASFADLFATHPPIAKRIAILESMAGATA